MIEDKRKYAEANGKFHSVSNPTKKSEWEVKLSPIAVGMKKNFKLQKQNTSEISLRPWHPGVFPQFRDTIKSLPKKWDWRRVNGYNWITPIRNQGSCGACVAFAVTAAVESHLMIQRSNPNLTFDLSEASLFYTSNRGCEEGDETYGWYIPQALNFLTEEGICFEENFPYKDNNQRAELKTGTNRIYRISGYDYTFDEWQMKRWLVEEGPLIAMFRVCNSFLKFWNNGARGIYDKEDGIFLGNHAVLVVGYDNEQGCWICKNSHPRCPGNNGFFRISYGIAGIDNVMFIVQDVFPVDLRDEYCYDPLALRVVDSGPLGWRLIARDRTLKYLNNQEDALNALRVARRHTMHGAIGNGNQRPNFLDYIIEYWRGDSGLASESLTKVDYISFDPNKVNAVDKDEAGWEISYDNKFRLKADDMNDALAALRLIQRHTRIAFIGRKNTRHTPQKYIMTYWE